MKFTWKLLNATVDWRFADLYNVKLREDIMKKMKQSEVLKTCMDSVELLTTNSNKERSRRKKRKLVFSKKFKKETAATFMEILARHFIIIPDELLQKSNKK